MKKIVMDTTAKLKNNKKEINGDDEKKIRRKQMTIKTEDFQLCNSITEEEALLLDDKWTSQIKMDGIRIIAVVMDNQAVLVNRRGHLCNFSFEEVVEDVSKLPNGIYDGEVTSYDDVFNKIQRRAGTRDRRKQIELKKEIPAKYLVFDILNLNKEYITNKPLKERIEIIKKVFEEYNRQFTDRKPCVEMLEYKPIKELLEQAHKEDREGIIVKDLNATYQHKRSDAWRKCKFLLEKDLKMTKYTVNPKGIRVENNDGVAVQIAGKNGEEAKKILDNCGEVTISIRYLEQSPTTNMYRFPSFKEIIK
jgi:ATP-dependent DNA ligase